MTRAVIRVRWADPSPQKNIFSDVLTPDAVALQFSTETVPPFVAMGSSEHATTMWHWKSLRISEVTTADL